MKIELVSDNQRLGGESVIQATLVVDCHVKPSVFHGPREVEE